MERFHSSEAALLELVDVFVSVEPLHRHRLGFAGQVNFGVFLAQPTNCPAGPESIKALGTLDVGSVIKAAIAGKDATGRQDTCHEPECSQFVREQMDGIAEESGISILDDIRKVLGLTLNKFGSGSHHVHPLLRPT